MRSYVKRQTAKMTSEFVFFSSNPSLNHINIEKCLLLFATNTSIFTVLFNEPQTDSKSFIFAVCRLTYDHVTSNLISLMSHTLNPLTAPPPKKKRVQRKSLICSPYNSPTYIFTCLPKTFLQAWLIC